MNAQQFELPALYKSANSGSADAQKRFLRIIRWEYFLLFIVSAASATRSQFGSNQLFISILLLILAALFVFKTVKKLDQNWYRCRALAESVKTSTWRFSMRAHPFEDTESIEVPKATLRTLLRDILQANHSLAESLETPGTEQVTASMIETRKLSLEDRVSFYVMNRIDDQQSWYSQKSSGNRKAQRRWFWLTILIYLGAAVSLNADKLGFPPATLAFDPIIVLVTSALGWLQMKRHGELMASYNLTAHEIGIIRGNSDSIMTENEFSDFVNEAELAFSREHTQWVARRNAN